MSRGGGRGSRGRVVSIQGRPSTVERLRATLADSDIAPLLGVVLAVAMVQLVMRRSYAFGNLLLRRDLPADWIDSVLLASDGMLALYFGANDMGSLMIEENVVASAGTVHYLTLEQIKASIREAGYIPRQRNVHYEYIDVEPAPLAS